MDPMLQTKLAAAGLYLVVASILVMAHYRPKMRASRVLGVSSFFTVLASLILSELWWPSAFRLPQKALIALATGVGMYVFIALVQYFRWHRHELRTFRLGEPEDGADDSQDERGDESEAEDELFKPPDLDDIERTQLHPRPAQPSAPKPQESAPSPKGPLPRRRKERQWQRPTNERDFWQQ